MAISKNLLNDGEHVVVTTRTHVKALFLPILVLLVTLAAAVYLSGLGDGTTGKVIDIVVWVVAAIVFVWWVVRPFLTWLTTSYTFTNRRFLARSGFIAKEGRTIPLNRISGVDFEIGVIDRIFGCGTLVVSDASEQGRVELHDIPRVEQIQLRVADELHRLSEQRNDDGT
ncbi:MULTISPECIES: PH domain-containing protein [unclassified Nocardioides]|uniref:PH domain-containing protein n=1 Tax=unclassified Nocardioides TaxID=2615069 RepID=UPI0006FCE812|nr:MULTISPECIES: PH domain-containing protein [unclassified Nocardioides]KQY56498.1 hypothetical protein ASD30_09170 [Nocardioides sp. Root140]KQZ75254.1 hypothetical protein ASD66_02475 [Nocardioides sp. Root151]KRF14333.1 hypothetical protein ASH02_08270 [Nocardioides sp. Soil796]